MTIQLATGIIGGSASYPSLRGGAAPTLTLTRDRQAIRTAGAFGAALGALSAGAKAAETGKKLLAAAEVGIIAIEVALAKMETAAATAEDTGTDASAHGLSDTDRAILHNVFDTLRSEIANIVNATLFKDVALLDGDGGASRSITFGTGASGNAGADTTVTISAATAAELATGLDTASLLTQSGASAAEALVVTAQEAAAGIKGALRADQGRLEAGRAVGAHVTAGTAAVRNSGLEYQGIVDGARQVANRVALEGGLNIYGSDGGLKSGNKLSSSLVTGLDLGGSSADTGGAGETQGAPPSSGGSAPRGGGGVGGARVSVDITV